MLGDKFRKGIRSHPPLPNHSKTSSHQTTKRLSSSHLFSHLLLATEDIQLHYNFSTINTFLTIRLYSTTFTVVKCFIEFFQNWAEDLISGNTATGRFLVVFAFVCSIAALILYIIGKSKLVYVKIHYYPHPLHQGCPTF